MPEFLRTVVQQDVSISASSVSDLIDLPVNPISHILFTVRALNNTSAPVNYSKLADFASFFSNIEVLFKGQNIIQGSLTDLMILNALLTGFVPTLGGAQNTDNDNRWATFMLSFSRVPFWREEGFPATSRGEFQLRITSGSAPSGLDNFTVQVEAVQLVNESPSRFLKYTTFTGTQGTTGDADHDLPRGNPILGVLLFAANLDSTGGAAHTIEQVKLLVDNVERYYPLSNWETIHGEALRRIPSQLGVQAHFHHLSSDIASDNLEVDTYEDEMVEELLQRYAYLDFDPLKDGEFALQTEGRGRVSMRVNHGDTGAMRFMPVEVMGVQRVGAAA